MRSSWLFAALILSTTLALLDYWALATYFYWRYPWSDTFMHTLGGATVGVFIIALMGSVFRPISYLFLVAVTVIGWEVFEYSIGATHMTGSFKLDTSSDLLFDAVGGTIAYVLARFSIWRSV